MAVSERHSARAAIMQSSWAMIELTIPRNVKRRPTNARRFRVQESQNLRRPHNVTAKFIEPELLRRQKRTYVAIQNVIHRIAADFRERSRANFIGRSLCWTAIHLS